MIHFINTQTMQYPVFEGQIKFEHNIDDRLTYPEYELPAEYALVKIAEQPTHNSDTQAVDPVTPTLINGEWTLTWVVRDLNEKEREHVKQFKAMQEAAKLEDELIKKRREAEPLRVFMLVPLE